LLRALLRRQTFWNTCIVLAEAASGLDGSNGAAIYMDSGVENINGKSTAYSNTARSSYSSAYARMGQGLAAIRTQ
jgi:hypothetical protein